MRAIAPVLTDYIEKQEWNQVRSLFDRLSVDGAKGALLKADMRNISYDVPGFPCASYSRCGTKRHTSPDGFELEQGLGDRYWFCRIARLSARKPQDRISGRRSGLDRY